MFFSNRNPFSRPTGGNFDGEKKPITEAAKRRMWITVALTVLLFVIWFGGIGLAESLRAPAIVYGIMILYCVSFTVLLVVYLGYNRAFVNKDVTPDMLPAEWSLEKRRAFVEDTRARAERSRWMLMLIIPFVMVFLCEALYLFVWDGWLADLFGG